MKMKYLTHYVDHNLKIPATWDGLFNMLNYTEYGVVSSVSARSLKLSNIIIGWMTAWDCQVPYTQRYLAAMSCRGAQKTT